MPSSTITTKVIMATLNSDSVEKTTKSTKQGHSEEDRASSFVQILGSELYHSLSMQQSLNGRGKYSKLAYEIDQEREVKMWLLKSLDFEPKLRIALAQKLQQHFGAFNKDLLTDFNEKMVEDPVAAKWIQKANKYVRAPLQGKFPVKNSGNGHCGFCCVSQKLTGTCLHFLP